MLNGLLTTPEIFRDFSLRDLRFAKPERFSNLDIGKMLAALSSDRFCRHGVVRWGCLFGDGVRVAKLIGFVIPFTWTVLYAGPCSSGNCSEGWTHKVLTDGEL